MERDQVLFRTLFDTSPDALFIEDADGYVLDCNPAAEAICRTTRGKLVGVNVRSLIPEERASIFAGLDEAPSEFESIILSADGAVIAVFVRMYRIAYAFRPAVLVRVRDRSNEKRLGERLQAVLDANEELDRRIRTRTEALTRTNDLLRSEVAERHASESERKQLEVQLRSAQRLEAVGRLAGGVAHDFNNLLTVVVGRSEILLDQISANHPMMPDLMLIHDAAQRASRVIRQLLTLGRKETLKLQILDLNSVIGGMKAMLDSLIAANIRFTLDLNPATLRVEADRGQIEQVILNLVVNSLDAMSGGAGVLEIKTGNTHLAEELNGTDGPLAPGGYAVISVRDTGKGMDQETLSHIFEPYFTTKEESKGTGLGLSTVHGIVKQSGGRIVASSERGVGTVFRICLPGHEERPEPTEPVVPVPRGAETILVVEDSHVVRMLTRELLEGRGYIVLEAPNGDEALQACRQYAGVIHLLLTDITMPDMNGHDLAGKAGIVRPGMKVLLMSGHTDEITRGEISRSGYPFIAKPFTSRTLAAKVRESLDG